MRKKQKRFQDNAESRNVIEPGKEIFENIKGKWHAFFGNDHPISLELACGRGEYTVGLAREFQDRNFIGVDIKGARIWKGSSIANEEKLNNAAFLRTQIDHIEKFFEKGEVNDIWIIHPDPQPRDSDEKRRLTNNSFLDRYKNFLASGAWIRLKTDDIGLFEYTLEVLNQRKDVTNLVWTKDLYTSELLSEHYGIQTNYERKFLKEGFNINYLKFQFK